MNLHESPEAVRKRIRAGEFTSPTPGMCPGYAQANLVVLPKALAYDFLLFTQRNPKPCPVLEVSDTGSRALQYIARDCDIALDFPKYRIYEKGELTGEYTSILPFWRQDFVSFLIGCSFSFESELIAAGIEMRHHTLGRNVPMYLTNLEMKPAGVFQGKMVVSMRPIPYSQLVRAVTLSAAMPKVHGAPVHLGDPKAIGIQDLDRPDFGDPVVIRPGEVPVFWACGVSPQAAVMESKTDFVITHAPGHMLITDLKNIDLKE